MEFPPIPLHKKAAMVKESLGCLIWVYIAAMCWIAKVCPERYKMTVAVSGLIVLLIVVVWVIVKEKIRGQGEEERLRGELKKAKEQIEWIKSRNRENYDGYVKAIEFEKECCKRENERLKARIKEYENATKERPKEIEKSEKAIALRERIGQEIREQTSELRKLKKAVAFWEEANERAGQRIERAKENLSKEDDTPQVLAKMAKAWVEYKMLVWDATVDYLSGKKRPISIETASEFKQKLSAFKKDVLQNYKEVEYKYEYLLSLFPELQEYIDGNAVQVEKTEVVSDEYEDRREKYLTKEEWMALSDTAKSQLALDRYNDRRKRTNAQVGRDYEEYIAYMFREKLKGCEIVMFGEQKGLEDLGRDLIVKHREKIYIVQCKRWAQGKEIREKHIMQLFGSTIEYCWETKRAGLHPLEVVGKSVIPVFVATTDLSETAKQFAERLGVVFTKEDMGDYPQIKCNVGKDGEKIYHLPFDQQYNRVIIEREKGEFMAWTVEEAEKHGFRRAKKYYNV